MYLYPSTQPLSVATGSVVYSSTMAAPHELLELTRSLI